mgnify:CR=1 FL=1
MTVKNYSSMFAEDPLSRDFDDTITATDRSFNSQARSDEGIRANNFVDTSDELANRGLTVQFYSPSADRFTSFKAFITAYNESFSSDYVSEQVFGRIDPIQTFKQTTRSVTMSFVIPCATPSESFTMLNRIDVLRSLLYPTYTDVSNALTIDQSPLVRIKLMNLLTNNSYTNTYQQAFGDGVFNSGDKTNGVLAAINSLNVNFNLESDSGVFESGGTATSPQMGIYPKLIEVAVDFVVIHERNITDENSNTVYGTPAGVRDGGDGYIEERIAEFTAAEAAAAADQERAEEADRSAAAQAIEDTQEANFRTALSQRRELRGIEGMTRSAARQIQQGTDYDHETVMANLNAEAVESELP